MERKNVDIKIKSRLTSNYKVISVIKLYLPTGERAKNKKSVTNRPTLALQNCIERWHG